MDYCFLLKICGWKEAIQKIAETTFDLIGNKIADKITKVLKTSKEDKLETVESEIKMSKEKYVPPDYIRLI